MPRISRLAVLCVLALTACGDRHGSGSVDQRPTPGGVSPLAILHAGATDRGFARALVPRPFHFPRDWGPHRAYRHEWWYWTGHLQAADGERFGFELTFFRIALEPPRPGLASSETADGGTSARAPTAVPRSNWRARQIYVAHFAVTDIARHGFHASARYARAALGLAGARASPFRVWLDGWSVSERRPSGIWVMRAADPSYALALELRPLSPPVPNGDRGLSVKSSEPGSASYYYSIPRLAARGRLVRGARTLKVSGTAWLDREWGSGGLGPNEVGWEWFGLELDDGSDLMFYALRDRNGLRDPHSAGTWVATDGRARPVSSAQVHIDVLGHWTSPRGAVYPSRWRIRVRSLGLDVQVVPVLADQELDTTPRYWEGDVSVSGTRAGRDVRGRGYVELVGYAHRR